MGGGGYLRLSLHQPLPPGGDPTTVPMGTPNVTAATSSFTGIKLTMCRDVFQIFLFIFFLFLFLSLCKTIHLLCLEGRMKKKPQQKDWVQSEVRGLQDYSKLLHTKRKLSALNQQRQRHNRKIKPGSAAHV